MPGVAVARADVSVNELDLWSLIESSSAEKDWVELRLNASKGKLTDYPPCDVIGRICSEKLANAISTFTTLVKWLPVAINYNGNTYNYYFMHFPHLIEIVHPDKSEFAAGRIIAPHVIKDVFMPVSIMPLQALSHSVIVSIGLKNTIEEAGCVGVEFKPVPSS